MTAVLEQSLRMVWGFHRANTNFLLLCFEKELSIVVPCPEQRWFIFGRCDVIVVVYLHRNVRILRKWLHWVMLVNEVRK